MSGTNCREPLDAEPTSTELDAIEAEWPLIAAELELLDAQIVMLIAGGHATTMDRRRVRRAEHRVLTAPDGCVRPPRGGEPGRCRMTARALLCVLCVLCLLCGMVAWLVPGPVRVALSVVAVTGCAAWVVLLIRVPGGASR
jgi:Flp pilus assembly protein TadB